MRFALVLLLAFASRARADLTPMLFAIEKDGKTSYLLGTYHVGPSVQEYPAFVLNALARQPKFMSESGLSNETDQAMPAPKVPPVTTATLAKLRERGLGDKLLETAVAKPHLACMYYFMTEPFNGPRPFRSLDRQFFELAKAQGKLLEDLDDESVDAILAAVFDCDINEMAARNSPESMRAGFEAELRKFRDGIVEGEDADEIFQTRERNRSWLPKLVRAHAVGVFAVMGYGHLPDLLQSLRSLGFRVWRVTEN